MGSTKTFRLNNLTGGINSISEATDLITFSQTGQGAEASDIENFAPGERGAQTTCNGFTAYYTHPSGPITGMYRFIQSNGNSYFIFSQGTSVYKLVSGTATSIGMTVTSGAYLHFETAMDKLIVCDGVLAPQTWDGTNVATIGNGAPVGARQSLFYQNRLWIFGLNGGGANSSYLYYSNPNDPTTGYSTQFVQCNTNNGQHITSMQPFYVAGDNNPVILVAKSRSVGIMNGDGSDTPYEYSQINTDFGVPGFRLSIAFEQQAAYMTPNGVASYNAGQPYNENKLLYQYLSEKVRNLFQSFNPQYLPNGLCWHDWKNTRVSFAVPELSQSVNNVIWHYDYRLSCWYKERWGGSFNITANLIDADGTWYHGDSMGVIYIHGPTYTSFNGSPIIAYYKSAFFDFGDPAIEKEILETQLTISTQGTYGVGISSVMDYGSRIGKTNNVNLIGGAYFWNGGQWNSSGTYKWGAAPIVTRRFIPVGYFRSIQFNIQNSGLNQPLTLFELDFTVQFGDFR